jgi:hypothetical protein
MTWTIIKEKIIDETDKLVPLKERKIHKGPRWLSKEIIAEVNKKKKMWGGFKKSGSEIDRRQYKEVEKEVKRTI